MNKILLVEDDKEIQEMICHFFKKKDRAPKHDLSDRKHIIP